MGTARYYQADRNVGDAALSGVPLDDIDDETWARLPAWMQASVDAWTVDGRKVYLMSHRSAPDEEATPPPPDEPVGDEEATVVKPTRSNKRAIETPIVVGEPADNLPQKELT